MPKVLPFRGLRYNQDRIPLQEVIAPPYDVISDEHQERLYGRHPQNIVRLILGKESDRYASAAKHLDDWVKSGILIRDPEPCIYVLHQTFEDKSGDQRTRKGFIALCRIADYHERSVLPHEKTLAKPLEDRLKLLTATKTNLSQIFGLYTDADRTIDSILKGKTAGAPTSDVTFEGVKNQMWRIGDRSVIDRVGMAMNDRQVLIADGHHRYETALKYRDRRRQENPHQTGEEPYNYVMMFFTNLEDEGLVIYPTHRVIHSLPGPGGDVKEKLAASMTMAAFPDDASMLAALRQSRSRSFGFVVRDDARAYMLSAGDPAGPSLVMPDTVPRAIADLDVTVLHEFVLRKVLGLAPELQTSGDHLMFMKEEGAAIEAVRSGRCHMAFLLNPATIGQVQRVTSDGLQMPQKSTFFHPKLLSGLVLNPLDS